LLRDLQFVARSLARRPAFVLAAALSLGLALGATATVFGVADALLLRELPYRNAARLVAIWPDKFLANREVDALRTRTHSFEDLVTFSPGWLMALTGVETPRQLDAARVSGRFFGMLGDAPLLGRTLSAADERPGQDRVALLGYDLWRESFGGDTAVIGRSIRLDREAYEVVGVMPRGFRTFDPGTDLWTPLTFDPEDATWSGAMALGYGRLRAGVTAETASLELKSLAAEVREAFHLAPDWALNAAVMDLKEQLVGPVRPTLVVLIVAVAVLLLIASSNVANLLLVRTEERRLDLAVRASLGATPGRLAAFVLAEGLALGTLGGILGAPLAYAGVALLRRLLPPEFPRLDEIAVDRRVLLAALALTVGASLLVGLAPALRARWSGLAAGLRSGRTIARGQRTHGVVVALELALALMLTTGASLMGRSLAALNRVDPGLRPDHLLTLRLQPSGHDSGDALRAYWSEAIARVESIPGVLSAATILHLPTSGRSWHADVALEGRGRGAGESPARTAWQSVSPGYFRTAGVALLRGRAFTEADGPQAPRVVAVNSVFAERLLPGENPIGRRVRLGRATRDEWAEIVAVVASVHHDALDSAPRPEVYLPFAQRSVVANSLIVRTALDPLHLAPAIRERIATLDRDVPISEVRTMDALYAASLGRRRLVLVLLGLFAGIGLVLSGVGVYGVVAYGVRLRFKELGIRAALGAEPHALRRLVVGSGLRYAALGVAMGVPAALALARLFQSLVFGVTTHDPLSFTAIPMLLVVLAVAASWLPARRASAVDPVSVLRE
jgi:predicted permease